MRDGAGSEAAHMTFKTTVRLLILVCFAAVLLMFLRDRRQQYPGSLLGERQLVLDFESEDVETLRIEVDAFRVVLTRIGPHWFVTEPVRARAHVATVAKLLVFLEQLEYEALITGEELSARNLSWSDYGLEFPAIAVTVATPTHKYKLFVGDRLAAGTGNYLRVDGRSEVIVTLFDFGGIFPGTLEAFRDRSVFYVDVRRSSKIELQHAESFIQLLRTDRGWGMLQPMPAWGNGPALQRLLAHVALLEVASFVWDAPVAETPNAMEQFASRIQMYGLAADEALLRLSLWENRQDLAHTLYVGKPLAETPSEYYARTDHRESIFSLSAVVVSNLLLRAVDLRDPVVFRFDPDVVRRVQFEQEDRKLVLEHSRQDGWWLREPVKWKADENLVSGMIVALANLHAVEFYGAGAEEDREWPGPTLQVVLSASNQFARATVEGVSQAEPDLGVPCNMLLHFSGAAEDGTRRMQVGGSDVAYVVSEQALSHILTSPVDPLTFRERTVLALVTDQVRRIELSHGGQVSSVIRGRDGGWTVEQPKGASLAQGVLDGMLFHAANLRALRIEKGDLAHPDAYGLGGDAVTITFGLSGDEGIQRTLQLGYRSKTDGVYARLRGLDVLFVLPRAVADELSRPLVNE